MRFTSLLVSGAAALTVRNSAEEAKNRPVTKVINLLKDMQKQLGKETEADQAIYDKMACWCETNDKAKTKAIADAETKIDQLTSKIEELTGQSARLTTEIANLEKEVAANQQALDKATALREKQLAEFNAEEKDLLQSIGALKSAVTVLKKHNSFLQSGTGASTEMELALPNVALVMKHTFSAHGDRLKSVIAPSSYKKAEEFIQSVMSQAPSAGSYANQSGEIFGILSQMLETFEADLSNAQKEESANQAAYEDLKAAKEEEIAAGQAQIDKKTDELADTDEKNAQAKVDKEDTENTLAADQEFLSMLKEKCQMTDKEWEQRQKTRALEQEAVSKALEFLTSDDAHDLFTRTFNFLQLSGKAGMKERKQAAFKLLAEAAAAAKNPKLSALAARVQLDAFTKVKKAIDDMIADLIKEKADEIKHKDFCTEEFNQNEKDTEKNERKKADLTALIESLAQKIKVLSDEIENLEKEIADMQVQMKRAGEDREKENAEFQATVADQRATQKLLTGALGALKEFYAKGTKGAFLQNGQPAGPPPPAGFKSYENNAGGSGVIGMITEIVNDAKAMETEAIRDEKDAQAAYETFVQETNKSIAANEQSIVSKKDDRAKAEEDKVTAEKDLDSTMVELEQLANYKAELHTSCDFTLKNFDLRQEARDQEVEALRQAKAILSGADFKA